MTPRKFYDTVKAMRAAQIGSRIHEGINKDYYDKECRKLEQIIDSEIERVEDILARKEKSRRNIENAVRMFGEKGITLVPVDNGEIKKE